MEVLTSDYRNAIDGILLGDEESTPRVHVGHVEVGEKCNCDWELLHNYSGGI